jgi:membrane-associated phospholipid phosphatase
VTAASPLTLLLLTSSGFAALVVALLVGALPDEGEVRQVLLGWASPPVVAVLDVANFAGDWRLIIPASLVLFLMFPHARARWGVWLGLMIATPMAETAAKYLVGRARPEDLSLGFPSGHVTAAAAFFGAIGYLAAALPSCGARLAVRTGAALIVLLVALARVLLRAHWPSDALGGAALGLALASAAALVAQAPPGEDRGSGTPPSAAATTSRI